MIHRKKNDLLYKDVTASGHVISLAGCFLFSVLFSILILLLSLLILPVMTFLWHSITKFSFVVVLFHCF